MNTIGDYKGLKMRIPGLGGKVVVEGGGATVLTPAAEIYGALERGTIDAGEWIGPHDDMKLGLHKTARYYYYPGWHEPGSMPEFGFNRRRTRRYRAICGRRSTTPSRPSKSMA